MKAVLCELSIAYSKWDYGSHFFSNELNSYNKEQLI